MVGDRGWRRNATLALFILPSLVPLVLFTLMPMVSSIQISLESWNLISAPTFVGLDNYAKLLTDRTSWGTPTPTSSATSRSSPRRPRTRAAAQPQLRGSSFFRSPTSCRSSPAGWSSRCCGSGC